MALIFLQFGLLNKFSVQLDVSFKQILLLNGETGYFELFFVFLKDVKTEFEGQTGKLVVLPLASNGGLENHIEERFEMRFDLLGLEYFTQKKHGQVQ